MNLVQIDSLDPQPAQACFHFAANRISLETLLYLPILIPDPFALGEDIGWIGETFDRLTHDLFRVAQAVHRRCVDPVYTFVERAACIAAIEVVVILRSPGERPTRAADCLQAPTPKGVIFMSLLPSCLVCMGVIDSISISEGVPEAVLRQT